MDSAGFVVSSVAVVVTSVGVVEIAIINPQEFNKQIPNKKF